MNNFLLFINVKQNSKHKENKKYYTMNVHCLEHRITLYQIQCGSSFIKVLVTEKSQIRKINSYIAANINYVGYRDVMKTSEVIRAV